MTIAEEVAAQVAAMRQPLYITTKHADPTLVIAPGLNPVGLLIGRERYRQLTDELGAFDASLTPPPLEFMGLPLWRVLDDDNQLRVVGERMTEYGP